MSQYQKDLKVVLCGGSGVGKSGLIIKLITDQFMTTYDPTIEDSYNKILTVDNKEILLDILDTAGQEQFASMQQFWFREGELFIVVYSITSKESFKQIRHFVRKIATAKKIKLPNDDKSDKSDKSDQLIEKPFIIVGNKCDLEDEREVTHDQGKSLANVYGVPFFECSSFTQHNLDDMWDEAVRLSRRIYTINPNINIIDDNVNNADNNRESITNTCTATLCCGDNNDDKNKKTTDNVQFYSVKKLPPDTIEPPVLALKNFRIKRTFRIKVFAIAMISGLFLPIVLVLQTIAFLLYAEHREAWYFPEEYPYDTVHYSILLDYLGLIVGRQPGQDPQTTRTRKWFLRQNTRQKIERIILCLLMVLAFIIFFINILQYNNLNVSYQETAGPLTLFWLLWFLLSSWIAFEPQINPTLPPLLLSRLRSITLIFGEHFTHSTSAFKFLRAYSIARNDNTRLSFIQYSAIILLSIMYALVPGITRITVGDSSDNIENKVFFTEEWMIQIGAIIVNFLFMVVFIGSIEVQYTKNFDNYREWMTDLTLLLSKEKTDKQVDGKRARAKSTLHELIELEKSQHLSASQYGRDFSKHLFLSLTRRSNALGWLEIRSFLSIEGKLLFGEQELPTLFLMVVTIALAMFTFYRVFFISGSAVESILFNSNMILMLICLISLIRITITGYQFKNLQEMQERLLGEQKLWMRCNVASSIGVETNDVKLASFSEIVSHDRHRSHIEYINPLANAVVDKNLLKQDIVQIDSPHTNNNDDNDNKDNNDIIDIIEEEKEEKKYDDDKTEPLLSAISLLSGKKDKTENKIDLNRTDRILSRMDTTNWYEYNFGFLDDMVFIVRKKDIYPRLFKIKLNSVLAKAIAGVILSVAITIGKILFF